MLAACQNPHHTPINRSARAASLDRSSTSDKLIYYGNNGEHQKQMDKASSDMKNGETEQPKYEKYYCNYPDHKSNLYEENCIITNA